MAHYKTKCQWLFFFVCCLFIYESVVQAADATIDSTVHTSGGSHLGSTPATVFISDQTGYTFYRDADGTCVYRKTTDGGASWGSSVTVDSQTDCIGGGIWYDRWTLGDSTGTYIHIVTFDSGNSDLWYTRLDTNSDTLTATVNATGANQDGVFAIGANFPSVTKGTDGILYMGIQDGTDSFVIKSIDGGVNWTEAGTNPFDLADDFLILMPLSGGNILAIRWDISADDIQSKVFNGSSWDGSWTDIDTNATENSNFDCAFGATIDKTTGIIYLAYAADIATLGTDDDIRTAVYSGGVWSSKTDVLTNDSKAITSVKISIDENNSHLYVIYTAYIAANNANVYWKKSTDGMNTWGAEQGPINTTPANIVGPRINIMSNERIYAPWYVASSDSLLGNTVADISPPSPPEPPPKETLKINSTSPSDNATGVAVNTSVSATFSLLMNGSTLTTETFKLSNGSSEVTGSVTTNGKTATFTPSENLAYTTTYTARVTTKAQAANWAGTTLDNDYVWSFTTAEYTPPTIISTNPAGGATGVAVNGTITATFSEEMDASTITPDTFFISDGNHTIEGTISYSQSDKTVTFTPISPLSSSTTYTATITTEVRDIDGDAMASDYTWSFTTTDVTVPAISSTNPADGASGVGLNSTITATFNEEMDAATITTDTFTVSDGISKIKGDISYNNMTATFTPSRPFSYSTTYTVTITAGVKDLAGNAMVDDYIWSFATVDIIPPLVISTNPANGASIVAVNSIITVTFNEEIDSSTITTGTFLISDGDRNIKGTISYNDRTATFKPSGNLSYSTSYTAKITSGVKDLAGNALASDFTWSFTTDSEPDITLLTVVTTSPANGAANVSIHSVINATFSEEVDDSTITTDTFTVNDGTGNINGIVFYEDTTATFTPSNPLASSRIYTAKLTTGIKDLSGNALTADYTWSFTPDTTAPSVVFTSPANGDANVSLTRIINATFSEEMDAATIIADTFTVSDDTGDISGDISYSNMTATFTPSSDLSSSTTYTAKITSGVKDIAGNAIASAYTWSFATVQGIASFTIVSTNPANGDANVSLNSVITATFSEEMDASTITTDTFTVSDDVGKVSGDISYSNITATFTPSSSLSYSTTYTAKITPGVSDAAGNALVSAYTWSFTTIALPLTPTPTVIPTPTLTPVVSPVNTGVIFGYVFSPDEEPLEGVTITIADSDFSNNIETDEKGYYEFRDIAAGDYTLVYEKEDYQTQTMNIELEEGQELDLETITLEPMGKGRIFGSVIDRNGNPIGSAELRLKGEKTRISKTELSDASGFLEFEDLDADTYILVAKKKGYKKYKRTIKLKNNETKEIEIVLRKISSSFPNEVLKTKWFVKMYYLR